MKVYSILTFTFYAIILSAGTALTMNDVLSPDSKSIILNKDNDLYVCDLAEGKETRLTFDVDVPLFTLNR